MTYAFYIVVAATLTATIILMTTKLPYMQVAKLA